MKVEEEYELSKNQTRKLKSLIAEYSKRLGIPVIDDRFSAIQHILRICNRFPEINRAVRPRGGKVDGVQCADFVRYMIDHPIGEFRVGEILEARRAASSHTAFKQAIRDKRRKQKAEKKVTVGKKQEFYESWEWKKARYQVLQRHGAMCMLCGAKRGDITIAGAAVRIVVDHIKPLSRFWHLRLEQSNLQVLCDDCNMGKGAWDQTDWRGSRVDQPEPSKCLTPLPF